MAVERREWHGIKNRDGWSAGPWDDEPDKVQWTDSATGRDCLIVRGPSGALCGYVAVKPGDPWYGRDYSECTASPRCNDSWCEHSPGGLCSIHGGLTYAAACSEAGELGICHVTDDPTDKAWWFGFDCAHSGDIAPASMLRLGRMSEYESYRDIDYVTRQVVKLAQQVEDAQR